MSPLLPPPVHFHFVAAMVPLRKLWLMTSTVLSRTVHFLDYIFISPALFPSSLFSSTPSSSYVACLFGSCDFHPSLQQHSLVKVTIRPMPCQTLTYFVTWSSSLLCRCCQNTRRLHGMLFVGWSIWALCGVQGARRRPPRPSPAPAD